MIRFEGKFIYLQSNNYSLVFEIKQFCYSNYYKNNQYPREYIVQRYFGPLNEMPSMEPSKIILPPNGSTRDYNIDPTISSSFGDGRNGEVSVIILNSDNSFTNRFYFKEAKRIEGGVDIFGPHVRDVIETLDIVEYDEISNIELHNYYSICSDSDVYICKKKIVNLGKSNIVIKRLMSVEMPLDNRNFEITTFDGAWLLERTRHQVYLSSGTFVNQSVTGSSSHKHNPFFRVKDLDNGNIYAFNLIYCGNHKGVVDINPIEHGIAFIGINDFCFEYELKQGESFITPEALIYVSKDIDDITNQMHKLALNHIVNPNFSYKERPILFNTWEGSAFNINEENVLDMAEAANKIGVELLVIDDGWFKGRNNDFTSLGDWVADKNKFPNGLGNFANRVREKGLTFGIWVEPEMISFESDIFKAHPEYALARKEALPFERRRQLMIDLSNPEVVDYLHNCLRNLIIETKPAYIKWDFNRFITDTNSSMPYRAGEVMHRFVLGFYDLIERLTKEFKEVLFEGCASGGGRFDLAIAYYMPQSWGSDNSSSRDRIAIATGTFEAYPISTFGAHISRDCSLAGCYSSLEDRFNLQAFGGFGYEFDLRHFSNDELDIMKSQISYFKSHRYLFQYGNYYSIHNYFDDNRYSSFEVVSDEKDEAILFVAEIEEGKPKRKWKFKNLIKDAIYEVEVRKQANAKDIIINNKTGKELMEEGLDLGRLCDTYDHKTYPNGIFSRLIYIRKV